MASTGGAGGLRVVLLDRRDDGWRVGVGDVSGGIFAGRAREFRSATSARDVALALAAETGLLILRRDLRSSRAPARGRMPE